MIGKRGMFITEDIELNLVVWTDTVGHIVGPLGLLVSGVGHKENTRVALIITTIFDAEVMPIVVDLMDMKSAKGPAVLLPFNIWDLDNS